MSVLLQLKSELETSVDIFRTSCAGCKHPPGHEICEACTDIDHARLPRMFRWIWNVS